MNVCLDACFLIGIYDERDQHHLRSAELFSSLFADNSVHVAVIVWPALYEAVSTQLVKHRRRTSAMERDWRRLAVANKLLFIDDEKYRDDALESCLRETSRSVGSYRALSLTDRVLRAVLADEELKIDGIVTFNPGDFADICLQSRRELLS